MEERNRLNFAGKHVTHFYPHLGDKLIIGKFCSIAKGVEFIMNGANHPMNGISAFPFGIFIENKPTILKQSFNRVFFKSPFNHSCRITYRYGIRRNIFCYNGIRAYDTTVAHLNAGHKNYVLPNPNVASYNGITLIRHNIFGYRFVQKFIESGRQGITYGEWNDNGRLLS